MDIAVQVVALVPAEAASLPETVRSFERMGRVTVYDTTGDEGVRAVAASLGVDVESVPWRASYADCFNEVLARRADAPRLVVHADETVDEGLDEWREAVEDGRPGTIRIRHRTSETDYFNEEREARFAPAGDVLAFRGRFPPESMESGAPAPPERLPALPLVLTHYPHRWEGLAEQRIRRTMTAVEAALSERPDDGDVLYDLLHCHVSLHEWEEVVRLAERWREVDGREGETATLVDFHEAWARLRTGTPSEAARLLGDATARAPRFADAWFLLGELHRLAGSREAAAGAYQRAAEAGVEADPVAVEDHSLATWRPLEELARLAEEEGDEEAAASWRERAAAARAAPMPEGAHDGA